MSEDRGMTPTQFKAYWSIDGLWPEPIIHWHGPQGTSDIPPLPQPPDPSELVKELSDSAGDIFKSALTKRNETEKMKEAWAELKKMLDHDWGLDDKDYFEPVKRMMEEIEKKFELE